MTSSRALSKFLNSSQIETALVEVSKMADDERCSIALIGGAALQLYGSDRLTRDVDFVADRPFTGLSNVTDMDIGGYQGNTPSGIPVGVLIGGKYAELRLACLGTAVYESDLKVNVVRLSYLMALKMVAGRAKDEGDILTMLRIGAVDIDETSNVLKEYLGQYAADDFSSVVEETEWKKARDLKKGK